MPIYEYTCANDHTTTDRRTYAEAADHPAACPECGEPVRQVFHAPPVFYRRFGYKPYSPDDAARGETVREEICVSE